MGFLSCVSTHKDSVLAPQPGFNWIHLTEHKRKSANAYKKLKTNNHNA